MQQNFLIQIPASTPPEDSGLYNTNQGVLYYNTELKQWIVKGVTCYYKRATEAELLEAMKEHLKEAYLWNINTSLSFDSWFTEYINNLKK